MDMQMKTIHMNRRKCSSTVQMTLDDDFNVPDAKPDVEKIVKEQGCVIIQEIKPQNGKILVKGNLHFDLLYVSEDDARPVHSLTGELPFEEVVNMDNACQQDNIVCKWDLEDLSTSLINSRKCSVRAIVSFYYTAGEAYDEEVAVDVEESGQIWCQKKELDITHCRENKKDIFRVKDEIIMPAAKPNIAELLYSETTLQGVETRLVSEGLHISGEVEVFLLYASEDEERRIYYSQNRIPFSGTITLDTCNESMISHVNVQVHSKDIQVKPDDDGENRILDCEIVLELSIKVYEEESLTLLRDVYSTAKELRPVQKPAYYDKLLYKNNSKVRVTERMDIRGDGGKILQICNGSGVVRIDDEEITDEGIQIEGVIEIQLLYVTDADDSPLGAEKGVVPFSQLVEVKDIKGNTVYELTPSLEDLSVTMLDGSEAEVKGTVCLDVIAFDPQKEMVITQIEETELDMDKIQQMPGLVGYIAKEDDTLWDIAKRFYTTTDSIMEQNSMETEELQAGDKLLLVKKV